MINNDMQNSLGRYFANRNSQSGGAGFNDMIGKLKAKRDAIQGKNAAETAETAEAASEEQAEKATAQNQLQRYYNRKNGATRSRSGDDKAAQAEEGEDELTPMERREKELKAIMAKLDAEEAARNASRYDRGKGSGSAEAGSTSADGAVATGDSSELSGIEGFLNDMPLFDEFKSGLMQAFEMLDKGTAGYVNAQYELNYSTMQYVANAAGGYEYQETSVNIKLDLNYIKAAAGGQTGKALSNAIGDSTDFESLVRNLQEAGQSQQAQAATPQDFMTSMQDYFSPEKTAGRIVDFATSFFPMSDAFKKGGDTEEARTEFGEMMREAVQKGFDQAMGVLGKVPEATQAGIDKTHELTMAGIDDFIKNGLNKNKQDQGVYAALEQFAMSFEVSYSKESVSVSNGAYTSQGAAGNRANQQTGSLDTQA